MEPSFIWSDLTTQPDSNNIVWFLMGDFLRFSPWSGGLPLGKIFARFVAHCESYAQDLENPILRLGFCCCRVSWEREKKNCSRTFYFSLIIVKSLQLRGRRQITEPRKYCLVYVIVFFDVCFLYFFVSHMLRIWVNSLHSLISLLSDFQWS